MPLLVEENQIESSIPEKDARYLQSRKFSRRLLKPINSSLDRVSLSPRRTVGTAMFASCSAASI
jgi:hypothetical protein